MLAESLTPTLEQRMGALVKGIYVQKSMDLTKMQADLEQALLRLLPAF